MNTAPNPRRKNDRYARCDQTAGKEVLITTQGMGEEQEYHDQGIADGYEAVIEYVDHEAFEGDDSEGAVSKNSNDRKCSTR